jgi:hypothetical protein
LPVSRADEVGLLATSFNGLLERIQREEDKAAEHAANQLLRKIVSQIPGVVFQYRLFADGHGCFPFASEAFYDLTAFGLKQSATVPTPSANWFTPRTATAFLMPCNTQPHADPMAHRISHLPARWPDQVAAGGCHAGTG